MADPTSGGGEEGGAQVERLARPKRGHVGHQGRGARAAHRFALLAALNHSADVLSQGHQH